MTKAFRTSFFVSCTLFAAAWLAPSLADDAKATLFFDNRISYENEASVKEQVRTQCKIIPNLVKSINDTAAKVKVPMSPATSDDASGRKLSVEIIAVNPGISGFGVNGSVPSELTVHFSVKENDGVLLEDRYHCAASFQSGARTCTRLEKCATESGEYIMKLIKGSLY